jgi:hypothetical protein
MNKFCYVENDCLKRVDKVYYMNRKGELFFIKTGRVVAVKYDFEGRAFKYLRVEGDVRKTRFNLSNIHDKQSQSGMYAYYLKSSYL